MLKLFMVLVTALSSTVFAKDITALSQERVALTQPATQHTISLGYFNQNYLQYKEENHWLTTLNKSDFHFDNVHNNLNQHGLIWDTKAQIENEDASIYLSYQYGDFTAETGFSEAITSLIGQRRYFLQGSYNLYSYEKFKLSLNAKYESQSTAEKFSPSVPQPFAVDSTVHNAAIGVVGQYALNEHWTLSGTITSTAITNSGAILLPLENKYSNIALIGTSYSF